MTPYKQKLGEYNRREYFKNKGVINTANAVERSRTMKTQMIMNFSKKKVW